MPHDASNRESGLARSEILAAICGVPKVSSALKRTPLDRLSLLSEAQLSSRYRLPPKGARNLKSALNLSDLRLKDTFASTSQIFTPLQLAKLFREESSNHDWLKLYMYLFDEEKTLIGTEHVDWNDLVWVEKSIDPFLAPITERDAQMFALVRESHLQKTTIDSDDLNKTFLLVNKVAELGISFFDYIVVSKPTEGKPLKYSSMRERGCLLP